MEYKSLLNSNPLLAFLDAVKILWTFPKIILIFVVIIGFYKVYVGLHPGAPLTALYNLNLYIFLSATLYIFSWAWLTGGLIAGIDQLDNSGMISWDLLWQEGWDNVFPILLGKTITTLFLLLVAMMGLWDGNFIGAARTFSVRIPTVVLGAASCMFFQFYAFYIVLEGKSFIQSLKGSFRLVLENTGNVFVFTVISAILLNVSKFPTSTFGLPSAIFPSMIRELIHTLWASIGTAITWTYYVLYYKKFTA